MTRVNLVDPEMLTDQHLVAERLELTWVVKSAQRSLNSRTGLKTHPKFVLGPGHVSFFHDKLGYIKKRFDAITVEMRSRGMVTNHPFPDTSQLPKQLMGDYKPTPEALVIIKDRIRQRLYLKPSWYRYMGKRIDPAWIEEVYGE